MKQKRGSAHPGEPFHPADLRRLHSAGQTAVKGVAVRPAGQPTELPEILAAIRRHEALRSRAADPDSGRRRAAAEVGACLGTHATATIFQSVSADCRNLLSEVQPVLSLFLGRRAAGRLATRIVEAAVVRF